MASDSVTDLQSKPLSGLHLLLTYECNYECDHCFVWGGPSQSGTMSVETIEHILGEAMALGSIEWIYFEGGEAFLLLHDAVCTERALSGSDDAGSNVRGDLTGLEAGSDPVWDRPLVFQRAKFESFWSRPSPQTFLKSNVIR